MKRVLVILSVILITTVTAWSAPSGIHVLWEQHGVSGRAGGDSWWGSDIGVYREYSKTASYPVSGWASGTIGYAQEWFPDGWPVNAWSRTADFAVWAYGSGWSASASAGSLYAFQPQGDSLTLNVQFGRCAHSFEAGAGFSLVDMTTMTVMETFNESDGRDPHYPVDYWGGAGTWSQTYTVDPSHIYHLGLGAWAHAGDSSAFSYIRLSPSPVPAPAAILLGTLGAGLVGWMRRRRTL